MISTSSDLLKRKRGEIAKFALSKFLSQSESKQWILLFPLGREFNCALDPTLLIMSLNLKKHFHLSFRSNQRRCAVVDAII